MMYPATTIRTVTVGQVDLPLFEPFVIATGQFKAANMVLVRVELDDGTVGMGEASPSLSSGGETAATIMAAANEMATVLPGRDVGAWRQIAEFLRQNFAAHSCARAAVEMALLDAMTRFHHMPLFRYFGGAGYFVETDMTVSIVPPEQAREQAARIWNRNIRTIKIKVGSGLADDEARVLAVHQGAPNAAIMLDGNQGYDSTGARRLLDMLEKRGIVPILFEQPVHRDDWDGLVRLTATSPVPIAADESVHDAADALRVVRDRAAHVINIKLMKCTFLGAIDIVSICHTARVGLMIGAMMESRLATAAAAHFVCGMGGFRYVDLDTPMFIDGDPFHGGYTQTGGRYDVSGVMGGHGVERW